MRNILVLLALITTIAPPAFAEQARPLKFDQSASSKQLPVKPPKTDTSCAAYGAGFIKLADSDTCVKIGGSISVGAGGSIRGR